MEVVDRSNEMMKKIYAFRSYGKWPRATPSAKWYRI
jgi:hypothetical protein